MKEGREGRREEGREEGREGGKEGGKEGGREGGRQGGREGEREEGRKGGRREGKVADEEEKGINGGKERLTLISFPPSSFLLRPFINAILLSSSSSDGSAPGSSGRGSGPPRHTSPSATQVSKERWVDEVVSSRLTGKGKGEGGRGGRGGRRGRRES